MSRTYHHGKNRGIRIRGIRRPTDLKRLAKVLIELEAAKAEAEAELGDRAERDKQPGQKRRAA
jgi:hypothetical protein